MRWRLEERITCLISFCTISLISIWKISHIFCILAVLPRALLFLHVSSVAVVTPLIGAATLKALSKSFDADVNTELSVFLYCIINFLLVTYSGWISVEDLQTKHQLTSQIFTAEDKSQQLYVIWFTQYEQQCDSFLNL